MSSFGYMRFLNDLPALKKAFAEMGPEGWQNLIDGKEGKHADLVERAWPIFIDEYFNSTEAIPAKAAREYLQALDANRVPQWIQDMALLRDIKRAAKG